MGWRKRQGSGWLVYVLVGFLALLSSCAGGGAEEEGVEGGLEPTLPSIQVNIFTPICAVFGCHTGANAPQGLRLDSATESFNNLVGVPSVGRPDLMLFRVDPGSPDESYLVWKIEGRPGIEGGRMPLNQAPLSSEQIDAIRQWILAGAPPP